VGVVQGCNLQGKNHQQRKQLVRYQNRENKSKSAGPNSAIKNVIKKATVKGYKRPLQTQQFGNVTHQIYVKANVSKLIVMTTSGQALSRL
jgi:hypothetical protein